MPESNQDTKFYNQLFAKSLQEAESLLREDKRMPKVGDIVLYKPGEHDREELRNNQAEILPAVVVRVWSETCVNLKVFTDGPVDVWETSVVKGDAPHNWNYRPE